MIKKISLLITIGLLSSGVLVFANSVDPREYNVSEHKKVTDEQKYEGQHSIQIIYTHFGEFYRANEERTFKKNEIARSPEQINSKTKELIFDYGIFIKK